MTTKKFIENNMPMCEEYDATMCKFDNGDELYIIDNDVSDAPYKNGYLLELDWYDHETELTWNGIYVYVHQGWIDPVLSFETSYDEQFGFCGIDSVTISDFAPSISTPLYMDAKTEWKALLLAAMEYE